MSLSQESVQSMMDAISIVAQSQINNISYDETIICTIVDNSHAKQEFYYTVTDGNIRFDAYVTSIDKSDQYKVNDQVYVKIPKGDYSQQKIIEGRYIKDKNNSPDIFISPLDTFVDMSNLLTITNEEFGLAANGAIKEKLIWSWDKSNSEFLDLQANNIYNALGLKADFKTIFDSTIFKGNYGLRLEVQIQLTTEGYTTHFTKSFELDSNEMFGNPYSFNDFFIEQSKMIDISNLGIIDGIKLYFYQKDNFIYLENQKEKRFFPDEKIKNLLVKNISLSFGNDVSQTNDNVLYLYTTNDLNFKYQDHDIDTNRKNLGILWCNKTEENQYIGFSDGIADIEKDENNNEIIKHYDEIEYLKESYQETRLLDQIGKDVPTDYNGLEVAASIAESKIIFDEIAKIINKELIITLNSFKSSIGNIPITYKDNDYYIPTTADEYLQGKINAVNIFYKFIDPTKKAEDGNLIKPLFSRYAEMLSAAAGIQVKQEEVLDSIKSGLSNSFPSETECSLTFINEPILNKGSELEISYKNIFSKFMTMLQAFFTDDTDESNNVSIEKYLNDDKTISDITELLIAFEASSYPGKIKETINIYLNRLNNIFTKLINRFIELNNLLLKSENYPEETEIIYDVEPVEEKLFLITSSYSGETTSYSFTKKIIESYDKKDLTKYDNRYCIYWYRYSPGYKSDDIYENKIIENEWEKIPVGFMDKYLGFVMPNNLGLPTKYYPNNDIFYFDKKSIDFAQLYLDPNKKEEKFKVILFYNHEKFESNELVFTNLDANLLVDEIIKDQIPIIEIEHGNNSMDSYQTLYDDGNVLINSTESRKNRELKIKYIGKKTDEELIGATICWYLPNNSTMLTTNIEELEDLGYNTDYYQLGKIIGIVEYTKVIRTGPDNGYNYSNKIIDVSRINENGKQENVSTNKLIKDDIIKVYGSKEDASGKIWYSLQPSSDIGQNGMWICKDYCQIIEENNIYRDGWTCFYKIIDGIEVDTGEVDVNNNPIYKNTIDYNSLKFIYNIKNYFSSSTMRNTIECVIIRQNSIRDTASIKMIFGTQGTNGTDYSIFISPINQISDLNKEEKVVDDLGEKKQDKGLILKGEIFDYNNESISIYTERTAENNAIIYNPEASWFGPTSFQYRYNTPTTPSVVDNITVERVVDFILDESDNNINNICGIAEFKFALHDEQMDHLKYLSTLYPIPWTCKEAEGNEYYIEGTTSIVYDNTGSNPVYYKDPYKIFNSITHEEITDVRWQMRYYLSNGTNGDQPTHVFYEEWVDNELKPKIYKFSGNSWEEETVLQEQVKFYLSCMPKLSNMNKISPCTIFVSEENKDYLNAFPVVQCYNKTSGKLIYSQPIIMKQDKYPNSIINDWNGKFTIDEENGTILSTMVAAGYKSSEDNTFYGIMMGDIDGSGEKFNKLNKQGIGLYGFNNGAQSFGFNIDGTAFIGKSGAGRINFDGNKGIIGSSSFFDMGNGMLIDLDDGYIDMKGEVIEKVSEEDYHKALVEYSKDTYPNEEEKQNLYLDSLKIQCPTYADFRQKFGAILEDNYGIVIKVQSSIRIDTKSPYFNITSSNGNNLIHIANDNYSLQSDNYSNSDNNTFIIDGFVSESYIPFDSDEEGWACVDKGDYYYYYWKNEYNNKYTNISLYGTYTRNPSTNQITFNDPYTFNSADPTLGKDPVTWYLVKNKSTGKYYYYLMANDKSYNDTTLIDQGKDKRIKNVQYSGTRVDLNNGEINAYDLILLSNNILFNSSKKNLPYLIIQSNDYKQLIYISDNNYFLQSNNYDDSFSNIKDGMRIDLYNKYIKTKNVQIATSNPYFLIKDNSSDVELVKFGTDAMFIQSPKYQSNTTGMRINLLTGNIDTKRIKIYSQESYDSKWLEDNAICFAVKDESLNNLIYIGNTTDFYLQSRNYTLTDKSSKEITEGLKIDLDDGSIKSKNFILNSETGFSATVCGGNYSNIIFAAGIKGTNSTSGKYNYAFGIQSGGGVIISHGKIGKWTLANDGYFTSNHTNGSTIYYSRFMPSSDYDNVIVIGSTASSSSNTTGAQFIVDKYGALHTNSTNYKGWNLYSTYLGTGDRSSTECFYLASQGDEWIAPSDTSYSASPWMRAYNTSGNIVFQLDRDGKANLKYLKINNFTYTYSSGDSAESHSCELDFTTSSSAWTAIGVGAKYTSTLGTMHAFTVTRQGAAHIKSGTIGGQWISNIAQTTAVYSGESDKNVKNSISLFEDNYENLFDNLKPCKYKYNHGTSNRYHTGFIAQEVVEAIENADLTTQDFAGVIKLEEPNDNGCEWLLRRDEFVALNTWQIQKLKSRISELENEILKIKGEKGLC